MKKRSTWLWIVAISMVVIFACAGLVGLGLWSARAFGNGGGSGLPFGDAVAVVRVEGVIVPGEAPPPIPSPAAAPVPLAKPSWSNLRTPKKMMPSRP